MRAVDATWSVFVFSNSQDLMGFSLWFVSILLAVCFTAAGEVGSQFNLVICQDNSQYVSVDWSHYIHFSHSSPWHLWPFHWTYFTQSCIPHSSETLHEEHFTAAREGDSSNYLNTTGWKLSSEFWWMCFCSVPLTSVSVSICHVVQWCEKVGVVFYSCSFIFADWATRASWWCYSNKDHCRSSKVSDVFQLQTVVNTLKTIHLNVFPSDSEAP